VLVFPLTSHGLTGPQSPLVGTEGPIHLFCESYKVTRNDSSTPHAANIMCRATQSVDKFGSLREEFLLDVSGLNPRYTIYLYPKDYLNITRSGVCNL
jgi:hypothetical protein